LRTGDLYLRLLFENALGRDAQVVVVGESLADEVLQFRFAINGCPLLVAEGCRGVA
jgi:hypothetical protein